jgi:hypothetical protein
VRRALAIATIAAVALALGASSALAATTRAQVYSPFKANGAPAGHVTVTEQGSCFSGSLAVERSGAWRCASGDRLLDPCFSNARASGVVICSTNGPWSSDVVKLHLTKGLPTKRANRHAPSTRGLPWALITQQGWHCGLLTGTPRVVHGTRLNYICTGTPDGLWGSPIRSHEPWRILVAARDATSLKQTVAIRTAWF